MLKQIRVSAKLIRKYGIENAILFKLEGFLSVKEKVQFSLSKSHLLLIDSLGKMKALPFKKQWNTIQSLLEKRERVRFHINLGE